MRLKIDRYPERRQVKRGVITVEDIRKKFKLPPHAEITVRVPGGADWSNMDIEMGRDFPGLAVKVEDFL